MQKPQRVTSLVEIAVIVFVSCLSDTVVVTGDVQLVGVLQNTRLTGTNTGNLPETEIYIHQIHVVFLHKYVVHTMSSWSENEHE